jgi:two-component system, chemotaxis family, response regulator Rcp1
MHSVLSQPTLLIAGPVSDRQPAKRPPDVIGRRLCRSDTGPGINILLLFEGGFAYAITLMERLMSLNVLLVEDSPGDVRLTQEAFRDANRTVHLHVAVDGVEAMEFLRQEGSHGEAPRPDFILLDLKLPKLDGREVLGQIKNDPSLRDIPTVILTTSEAEADVWESYRLRANSYLAKPVRLSAFENLIKSINESWLVNSKLPSPRIFVAEPGEEGREE